VPIVSTPDGITARPAQFVLEITTLFVIEKNPEGEPFAMQSTSPLVPSKEFALAGVAARPADRKTKAAGSTNLRANLAKVVTSQL
jgi:hypothetical protein